MANPTAHHLIPAIDSCETLKDTLCSVYIYVYAQTGAEISLLHLGLYVITYFSKSQPDFLLEETITHNEERANDKSIYSLT